METIEISHSDVKKIILRLDKIESNYKKVIRQFSYLQRTLDLLHEDGDILTDIQNSVFKGNTLIIDTTKELKTAVVQTGMEIKDNVDEKTSQVEKKVTANLAQKIILGIVKTFKPTDTTLEKKKWYQRLPLLSRLTNKTKPVIN